MKIENIMPSEISHSESQGSNVLSQMQKIEREKQRKGIKWGEGIAHKNRKETNRVEKRDLERGEHRKVPETKSTQLCCVHR